MACSLRMVIDMAIPVITKCDNCEKQQYAGLRVCRKCVYFNGTSKSDGSVESGAVTESDVKAIKEITIDVLEEWFELVTQIVDPQVRYHEDQLTMAHEALSDIRELAYELGANITTNLDRMGINDGN